MQSTSNETPTVTEAMDSELTELHHCYRLYLKPVARINITVQVPSMKQLSMSKAISNWEVMEKLRTLIRPLQFTQLKVVKNTLEFIRFQAELESRTEIKRVKGCLDSQIIKLSGFPNNLRVRASEVKLTYPSRHDWDAFFRDARDMNEMQPGERPDTLHLSGLPTRWFTATGGGEEGGSASVGVAKPSVSVLTEVFQVFGEVRCVDIPLLDPCRGAGSIVPASFHEGQLGLTFDAYIQYREYLGFVRAMDTLRGRKLVHRFQEGGPVYLADIKVDFDCTKHLSDQSIRRRRQELERQNLLEKRKADQAEAERQREQRDAELAQKAHNDAVKDQERRRRDREQKRRHKAEEIRRRQEELAMQRKIALEERKILIATRKLESIRLLSVLLNTIKVKKEKELVEQRERELELERLKQIEEENKRKEERAKKRLEAEQRKKEKLLRQEKELREKILKNLRESQRRREREERDRLRRGESGCHRKSKVAASLLVTSTTSPQ